MDNPHVDPYRSINVDSQQWWTYHGHRQEHRVNAPHYRYDVDAKWREHSGRLS